MTMTDEWIAHDTWREPPVDMHPGHAEAHVWLASLDPPQRCLAALGATLDTSERARAARFRLERDRRRFIASRGILRALLGFFLDTPPADIVILSGRHGKPAVAPSAGRPPLHFNLSHSEDRAIVVVARDCELGVDIEYVRHLGDEVIDAVARTAFSPRERVALSALAGAAKEQAFYTCWTRKEAYIKGTGDGLHLPLGSFDVSLMPGEPARLLDVRGNPAALARWSYVPLPPIASYATALAVERPAMKALYWRWASERSTVLAE